MRYQLDLPVEESQRELIQSLRAWLALDRDEARAVTAAFDRALDRLLPEEREDVVAMVRDAIYNGLSFYEFERLAEFWPTVRPWRASLSAPSTHAPNPYALIAAAMCGIGG